ncbi:unnamed protein product, partial [Mesorhabditis belari]|uniref:RRM domain-containing protein n=1 Tax=Mesorhabditis belari TaxID=2138241 RepID=A0AAF3EF77_9BILA
MKDIQLAFIYDTMSRVYLGRLPYRATVRDIERFLEGYGSVRDISLKYGFAFVDFENVRDAEDAVHDLHGKTMPGDSRFRIIVELAKGNPRGGDAYRYEKSRSRSRSRGQGVGIVHEIERLVDEAVHAHEAVTTSELVAVVLAVKAIDLDLATRNPDHRKIERNQKKNPVHATKNLDRKSENLDLVIANLHQLRRSPSREVDRWRKMGKTSLIPVPHRVVTIKRTEMVRRDHKVKRKRLNPEVSHRHVVRPIVRKPSRRRVTTTIEK